MRDAIFIGPQEIAGFLTRISLALASHGKKVIAFKQFHSDKHPELVDHPNILWMFPKVIRHHSSSNSFIGTVIRYLLRFLVLIRIICSCRAALFIGGKGLFNLPLDYYFLRLCGVRVVHMYVGTASRPRFLSSYALKHLDGNPARICKLAARILRQKKRVRATSRAASLVIENPLCGHFQNQPFINFFHLGIPMDVAALNAGRPDNNPNPTHPQNQKIRILHCPSNPEIKGTGSIKNQLTPEVLASLNAELVILTGVSRTRVLQELGQCDFVIDQLYSDTPLAGFAAEAAFHGKLPVVGGFGWDEIFKSVDEKFLPPSSMCHPDNLLNVVKKLCQSPDRGAEQAQAVREFMESGEWSQGRFAAKLLAVLDGNPESEWFYNPREIRYFHGVGLSAEQSKEILAALIGECGIQSLQVSHIPELEGEILRFTGGSSTITTR